MKILKTLVLGALLALVCCLIYDRITHPPEDWQTPERCKACDALEDLYAGISTDQLITHYKRTYLSQRCRIPRN